MQANDLAFPQSPATPIAWDQDAWDQVGRQLAVRAARIEMFPRWLRRLQGLRHTARDSTLKAMRMTWALSVVQSDPTLVLTPGDIEEFLKWREFREWNSWMYLAVTGKVEEAISFLNRAVLEAREISDQNWVRTCLSLTLQIQDRHAEALQVVEPIHNFFLSHDSALRPNITITINLWRCLKCASRDVEAVRYHDWACAQLSQLSHYNQACFHCMKGQENEEMSLVPFCDLAENWWPLFDPDLKALHNDSRFLACIERKFQQSRQRVAGLVWPP